MTYKIFVHTPNAGILVFKNVKEYSEEGSFIKFVDVVTEKTKLFPIENCQIEVDK